MKYFILILMLLNSANVMAKDLKPSTSDEYLAVIGVEKLLFANVEKLLNPLAENVLRGMAQNIKRKGFSDEKATAAVNAMRPHLNAVLNNVKSNFSNLLQIKDLKEEVYYPALAKSFSDEELLEIIEFLKTPVGKKYVAESTTVLQRSAELTQKLYGAKIENHFEGEIEKVRGQAIKDITEALKK